MTQPLWKAWGFCELPKLTANDQRHPSVTKPATKPIPRRPFSSPGHLAANRSLRPFAFDVSSIGSAVRAHPNQSRKTLHPCVNRLDSSASDSGAISDRMGAETDATLQVFSTPAEAQVTERPASAPVRHIPQIFRSDSTVSEWSRRYKEIEERCTAKAAATALKLEEIERLHVAGEGYPVWDGTEKMTQKTVGPRATPHSVGTESFSLGPYSLFKYTFTDDAADSASEVHVVDALVLERIGRDKLTTFSDVNRYVQAAGIFEIGQDLCYHNRYHNAWFPFPIAGGSLELIDDGSGGDAAADSLLPRMAQYPKDILFIRGDRALATELNHSSLRFSSNHLGNSSSFNASSTPTQPHNESVSPTRTKYLARRAASPLARRSVEALMDATYRTATLNAMLSIPKSSAL